MLGWAPDGPRLRLDYRAFAYAGKFTTPATGVSVATDPDAVPTETLELEGPDPEPLPASATGDGWVDLPTDPVVAAVAHNADRNDAATLWLRYVTVRSDRRGEGLGARLLRFTADRAAAAGYETARIAVNNPFSYGAASKAGFASTGRTTGLAELVLERPTTDATPPDPETYRRGLAVFHDRDDLAPEEAAYVRRHLDGDPPALVALE